MRTVRTTVRKPHSCGYTTTSSNLLTVAGVCSSCYSIQLRPSTPSTITDCCDRCADTGYPRRPRLTDILSVWSDICRRCKEWRAGCKHHKHRSATTDSTSHHWLHLYNIKAQHSSDHYTASPNRPHASSRVYGNLRTRYENMPLW